MSLPTHAKIDKAVHLVTKIDEHGEGPGHTHRVHLACGITVDVDIGGVRAHRLAMRRAEEHESDEWARRHRAYAAGALAAGDAWDHKRWTDHDAKATCEHCEAVETGAAEAVTHERAHTPPKTVRADTPTGLPCPTCGAELRIRANGSVACTAQGHEFTVPDVLTSSMDLLRRLALGGKE